MYPRRFRFSLPYLSETSNRRAETLPRPQNASGYFLLFGCFVFEALVHSLQSLAQEGHALLVTLGSGACLEMKVCRLHWLESGECEVIEFVCSALAVVVWGPASLLKLLNVISGSLRC